MAVDGKGPELLLKRGWNLGLGTEVRAVPSSRLSKNRVASTPQNLRTPSESQSFQQGLVHYQEQLMSRTNFEWSPLYFSTRVLHERAARLKPPAHTQLESSNTKFALAVALMGGPCRIFRVKV